MSPETWTGIGQALAGAVLVLGGQEGIARFRAKKQNGNGNGHEGRLLKLEREVLDSAGMVRTRFHAIANATQVAIGKTELQALKIDKLEQLAGRLETKLESISGQIGDLREDVARLGGGR